MRGKLKVCGQAVSLRQEVVQCPRSGLPSLFILVRPVVGFSCIGVLVLSIAHFYRTFQVEQEALEAITAGGGMAYYDEATGDVEKWRRLMFLKPVMDSIKLQWPRGSLRRIQSVRMPVSRITKDVMIKLGKLGGLEDLYIYYSATNPAIVSKCRLELRHVRVHADIRPRRVITHMF